MAEFTSEEKRYIHLYILENKSETKPLIDNDDIWRTLGDKLGRNWKDVRNAYFLWSSESSAFPQYTVLENMKLETKCEQFLNGSVREDELVLVDQLVFGNIDDNELQRVLNEEYIVHDAQPYCINTPEESYNYTEIVNTTEQQVGIKRRQQDLSGYDQERLKILEDHSREELEMRRKEHEQKMKYYSIQIKNGLELHKEKMKIYVSKYKSQLEKIADIDHAISNKIIMKKYRSGPI